MNKPGDEQWALLPNYGTNNLTPGTYYVLVASQGQNLVNSCGTGTAGYTLSSWIDGVTNLVGTLGYGSDLTYTNSQPGGSLKFYQFTVPAGLASIQVTLEMTGAKAVLTPGVTAASQPGDEKAQVVPGGDQDGVDGIAGSAGQVIALEQAIRLGMADDRLDGISSPQLAVDRG